ncbi:MAG: HD domain-containing protein, partial [Thermoleophilia bacterium]|nr:HD domain-containing protein [Thermoleophilia bacterium]
AAERRSVARLVADLGPDWLALWDEYDRGASPEAQFVRQLDRLEMALQASAFRLQGEGGSGDPFAGFFTSARRVVTDPDLARGLEALASLRPPEKGD